MVGYHSLFHSRQSIGEARQVPRKTRGAGPNISKESLEPGVEVSWDVRTWVPLRVFLGLEEKREDERGGPIACEAERAQDLPRGPAQRPVAVPLRRVRLASSWCFSLLFRPLPARPRESGHYESKQSARALKDKTSCI